MIDELDGQQHVDQSRWGVLTPIVRTGLQLAESLGCRNLVPGERDIATAISDPKPAGYGVKPHQIPGAFLIERFRESVLQRMGRVVPGEAAAGEPHRDVVPGE